MKKVIIVGGGISGLVCGIYLQKYGFQSEIYEKHTVPGGQCTGWNREGFHIDNCIHWLTGTREGSALNELWKETGALGDGIELRKKDIFFSSEMNGQTLTFYRDKERTRREMLALSPDDEKAINSFFEYVKLAESMTVPAEKPMDAMNLVEFMRLGSSMKDMMKVMKEFGNKDLYDFAEQFRHPLIRQALIEYMPEGYLAYAFLTSYGTITSGNGDIPAGGSLKMSLRMAQRYRDLGGKLITGTSVQQILTCGKKASGVLLENGSTVNADYVVSSCDTDVTFSKLLPTSYMPLKLRKAYSEREKYPVTSGFQMAFAIDCIDSRLSGARFFDCDELTVGKRKVTRMAVQFYDYEPDFAPEGKLVAQSNFLQTDADYDFWKELYADRDKYDEYKRRTSESVLAAIVKQYPFLEGKIHVIDVWTPVTYNRYCGAYCGAYMSFITTKGAKDTTVPGVIKGLDNVFLAGQWLMGPGGLPIAAAQGKFAAWRIAHKEGIKV